MLFGDLKWSLEALILSFLEDYSLRDDIDMIGYLNLVFVCHWLIHKPMIGNW